MSDSQHYVVETVTLTSVKEHNIIREVNEDNCSVHDFSTVSSILKGGRLWKQQSLETTTKLNEQVNKTENTTNIDEESSNRRYVRFTEVKVNNDYNFEKYSDNVKESNEEDSNEIKKGKVSNSVSPESTEMMLTFKLGNHVLISNNSLKPNSAVRQLFPYTEAVAESNGTLDRQHLVTTDSLSAFEEAKHSKLLKVIHNSGTNDSIKQAIERNTLRRSLIRYEPRSKKNVQKTDNSLVERIKQLTCDIDETNIVSADNDERVTASVETQHCFEVNTDFSKHQEKSFSPSSSSTASSNSSTTSSAYKKMSDIFSKREKFIEVCDPKTLQTLPDIGGPYSQEISQKNAAKTVENESRKQFLSTLAPLTACVSTIINPNEYNYQIHNQTDESASVTNSGKYSLEDINEKISIKSDCLKGNTPDVIAGTPSASESGDELAVFVQQDACRIERIKKKYCNENTTTDEDDEHDDYGFNKRPSVQSIKPKFGSPTDIFHQIQNQLQLPSQTPKVTWPYYSETKVISRANVNTTNLNHNVDYSNVNDEIKMRENPQQYRYSSLQDNNLYKNCTNQRCFKEIYSSNLKMYSSVVGFEVNCKGYQTFAGTKNARALSPPPQEISKNSHQTMVYVPYNHLKCYQTSSHTYHQNKDFLKLSNYDQINKKYSDSLYYPQEIPFENHFYNSNSKLPYPVSNKSFNKSPYSNCQPIIISNSSNSSSLGQFSTAKATQTSNAYDYCQDDFRHKTTETIWKGDVNYITKINRDYFPKFIIAQKSDILLKESDSPYKEQIPNGYMYIQDQKVSILDSPTKPKFIERGVPEGAVSVPMPDSKIDVQTVNSIMSMASSSSTKSLSPSTNAKPLFYAMNV